MKHSWTLRLIALIAALGLVASACSSEDEGDGDAGDITTGVGVTDSTITLAIMPDLSGPVAVIGKPIADGQEAYWSYVNEELDGVAGRRVELRTEDTSYDAQKAQSAYDGIKNEVLGIPLLFGTPVSEALKPVLEEDNVLSSPASLSSGLAQDPLFVMAGTPYAMSIGNAVDEIVNNQGGEGKRIVFVYQDDEAGQDALKGWETAKETYDFEDVGQVTYNATDTQFNEQVRQIVESQADFAVMAALPTQAAAMIGGAAQQGFQKPFYTWAPAWSRQLLQSPAAEAVTGLMKVTSSLAYWGEDVPGMTTMLEAVEKFKPEYKDNPDDYFTFGWTQALIYHAIMEKAVELGDLTREGLVNAFAEVGRVDTGGILPDVNYGDSPETRVPSREDRISEPVTDDSDYPGNLKPITDYFTSEAAKKVQL